MPQNVFTGRIAERYDDDSPAMFDSAVLEPTVRFLTDAARGGRALELAIGTGRVAMPLSNAGVEVHGIDISADMVAQLHAKPGSDAVNVTIGDFTTTKVAGTFSLVYLVYNTISNVLTQDEQVACFENAAAHLSPGGRFVIELGIPDLQRLPPGALAVPFEVTPHHLGFDTYELSTQLLVSHHYMIEGDRVERFDSTHRYIWPSELDLMARIAGLKFRERWADWNHSPFTNESRSHISVWERPQ